MELTTNTGLSPFTMAANASYCTHELGMQSTARLNKVFPVPHLRFHMSLEAAKSDRSSEPLLWCFHSFEFGNVIYLL